MGAVLHAGQNAQLGQRGQIPGGPAGGGGAVHKLAQVGLLLLTDTHSPCKHHHGLLPGDGLCGVAVGTVALHDAGGGALQNGVGVPLIALQVGIAVGRLLAQAQQPHKNGGQLAAGQVGGGPEQALVVSLHQAGLQPAVNGVGRPALAHVGQAGLSGGSQGGGAHGQPHGQGQQQGQRFLCLHG